MIHRGVLDGESRQDLIASARDGSAAHCRARPGDVLVLLDDGIRCEVVARALRPDDETIRARYPLYQEDGIEAFVGRAYEGRACRLSEEQSNQLKVWITEALPRPTREVGAWIARECGLECQGQSGRIALLHRHGMEHRQSKTISRKLHQTKQPVSLRNAAVTIAGPAKMSGPIVFHPGIQPASWIRCAGQPDRTIMGADAPPHHAQQLPRQMRGLRSRNTDISARGRTRALAL